MKYHLPFRLSPLGLLGLAIHGSVFADPQIQVDHSAGSPATTEDREAQ